MQLVNIKQTAYSNRLTFRTCLNWEVKEAKIFTAGPVENSCEVTFYEKSAVCLFVRLVEIQARHKVREEATAIRQRLWECMRV